MTADISDKGVIDIRNQGDRHMDALHRKNARLNRVYGTQDLHLLPRLPKAGLLESSRGQFPLVDDLQALSSKLFSHVSPQSVSKQKSHVHDYSDSLKDYSDEAKKGKKDKKGKKTPAGEHKPTTMKASTLVHKYALHKSDLKRSVPIAAAIGRIHYLVIFAVVTALIFFYMRPGLGDRFSCRLRQCVEEAPHPEAEQQKANAERLRRKGQSEEATPGALKPGFTGAASAKVLK